MAFNALGDLVFGVEGGGREAFQTAYRYLLGQGNTQLPTSAREQFGLYDLMALEELRGATRKDVAGFEEAKRTMSGVSRESRRGAVDRASQAGGVARARFGPSGVGTTAFDQANAGIRSSLSRELAGIDQAFAGLMGELSIGQGKAEASGMRMISQLFERSGERQAGLFQQLVGQIPITEPREGILGDILGLGAGFALGGGFSGGGATTGAGGAGLGSSGGFGGYGS